MAHTGRPTQAHPVGPPAGWPSKDPCHVPRIVGLEVGALLRVCPCVHGAPLHAVAWPVTTMPPPQDSHFQAGSVTIVGEVCLCPGPGWGPPPGGERLSACPGLLRFMGLQRVGHD